MRLTAPPPAACYADLVDAPPVAHVFRQGTPPRNDMGFAGRLRPLGVGLGVVHEVRVAGGVELVLPFKQVVLLDPEEDAELLAVAVFHFVVHGCLAFALPQRSPLRAVG